MIPTREDIIRMAREAGNDDLFDAMQIEFLERLVQLARAEELKKFNWDVHSCGPTCTNPTCAAMREAVAAEREACAKVCEEEYLRFEHPWNFSKKCADAIRARGQA